MEPKINLRFICNDCSDKKRKEFQTHIKNLPLQVFVKHYVKKAFPAEGGHKFEHMWVKISEVNEKAGTLLGTLANDPFFCPNLHNGDKVIVQRSEIEEAHL